MPSSPDHKAPERWTILACPDRECDGMWPSHEGRLYCDNYEAHTLGEYPMVEEVEVVPALVAERLVSHMAEARRLLAHGEDVAADKVLHVAIASFREGNPDAS